MMQRDVSSLPLSEDLLEYYRQRLEHVNSDYDDALNRIAELRITHEEHHKTRWELRKREEEIAQLQRTLADERARAFEERKNLLAVIAENDGLKVQELKDRKKIRYLLSVSGTPQEETTYFRDLLDKRLVRVHRKTQPPGAKQSTDERDLIILEDEIEGLKLNVSALQTQLEEQRTLYEQTISTLSRDREQQAKEDRLWQQHDSQVIAELQDTNRRLRTLCRENTKELLQSKKSFHNHERKLIEEKNTLVHEVGDLKKQLQEEKEKLMSAEKVIEARVAKRFETTVHDLRVANTKAEELAKVLKTKAQDSATQYEKKANYLRSRFDAVIANYNNLKRRRDYEIEGFTNDILHLRKQLKTLEKSILKYGPLEDKELILLNLAQETGRRAAQISTGLQSLKAKIYATENDLRRQVPV
ncbi:hypothetical protein BJ742DRAFT_813626 [Cladochytrium replicatum]|nr:hypothetical protein BJ742DRAFT_813626 [Cladochytrium replicatum]